MNRIPIPPISEFFYEDFMRPMNIDALTLSVGADIPLAVVNSILADEQPVTPEISEKIGSFFGISPMLLYDIQKDISARSTFPELQYA